MVVLLFEQPDFPSVSLHYASLDGQKSAIGQLPQSGFLARQTSRPNCTIRWQKSEERSGGINGRKSRSTFAGSLFVVSPSRPVMRIKCVSVTIAGCL